MMVESNREEICDIFLKTKLKKEKQSPYKYIYYILILVFNWR